jgi:hypothetical protein
MYARFIWLSFIFFFAASGVAKAIDQSWQLKGITNVGYSVSVDDMARQCGLDEQSLRAAIQLPINAYTQIHAVKPDKTVPHIMLDVTALTKSNVPTCAVYLLLGVHIFTFVDFPLPQYPDKKLWGPLTVWSKYTLVVDSKNTTPKTISNAVEDMAKTLALDWQTANR